MWLAMPASTGKGPKVVRKRKIPKSGSTVMRPRAWLVRIIGDELISDEQYAIVELVKNSYDADATRVDVIFEGDNPEYPERIIIKDNGHGMSLETVFEGWFEVGTKLKRKTNRSPGGRLLLGEKGIGRFAAARLGDTLTLETKETGKSEGVYAVIKWGDFDDESYLDEIEIDYETRALPDISHGTCLTVKNTFQKERGKKQEKKRTKWDKGKYKDLSTRLSRLVSPFEEDRPDFRVFLDIPGHADQSGEVQSPEIILKPKYMLRGRLDGNGSFTGGITIEGKETQRYEGTELGKKDERPLCGPFDVEVKAWDRDLPGLKPFAEDYGFTVAQIRGILNSYCGVNIYRDGFRIHPYGEPGNDWLRLDLRSRQVPTRNIANNQIVAAIRISRDGNPALIDRSTREGLVHNPEYDALGKWFTRVLSLLEEERYEVRPRVETIERAEPLFEVFDISNLVEELKGELGKVHKLTILANETQEAIGKGVKRVQELYERLLLMAGLGHMADILMHEIEAPVIKIDRNVSKLEKIVSESLDTTKAEKVDSILTRIKGWLEQLYNLKDRLNPQTIARRGRATTFDVREEIRNNFGLFEAQLRLNKIEYDIDGSGKPLMVKMSKASLSQIMVNLIDNAIYWVTKERGTGGGGRIHVLIKRTKGGFRILLSDDGPGVPGEDISRIFEPYFTRKPAGTGLGLYIARLLIEPYGKLLYRKDCELPGACFEAVFERSVGR